MNRFREGGPDYVKDYEEEDDQGKGRGGCSVQ